MAIYDLFLSRNSAPVTLSNYVGHSGRLFYDSSNGVMRLSDGVTPGGIPIPITLATDTIAGGVKLGPGVVLNPQGQIIIDSTGLDFNFGDFVATTELDAPFGATLSSANEDQDINIVSNGTGTVNVVGEFGVFKTDGTLSEILAIPPIFSVSSEGQVQMLVPEANFLEGAVTIVGSTTGLFLPPVNSGVMLHITGQYGVPGVPSRVYNDSQNAFSAFVARRYNGTVASPTAVLADEEIMRISGTAHNGTVLPGTGNQRFVFKALGNQTLTNQGGSIEVWTTPQNTTTIAKVATFDNADGITATKFKGPLTGNVTGNLTGNADTVTNGVYTAGDQTIGGTKTFSNKITGSISGNADGTAGVATTVTLVATNSTAATHYLTFVDSATGNENIRTDTDLTYNPSTNRLTVGSINTKLFRNSRDAGTIAANGTLTIDFSTDDLVYCTWGDGMNIAYQNYTAGSVVRLLATKATGTGTDSINLDGITAAHVSTGSTTVASQADVTVFIEATCIGTTLGSVYIKL
jgi:hypothetical protein